MDQSYYFNVLYPFQDEVLGRVAGLETEFYLTGGTAASRGYLQHRFSDDLDLFVNDDPRFGL
jgi:predicted nucleotidyltransferase component of viral defense system